MPRVVTTAGVSPCAHGRPWRVAVVVDGSEGGGEAETLRVLGINSRSHAYGDRGSRRSFEPHPLRFPQADKTSTINAP